jgi:hypothetical protein
MPHSGVERGGWKLIIGVYGGWSGDLVVEEKPGVGGTKSEEGMGGVEVGL